MRMDGFLARLANYRGRNVFNPWGEYDLRYDIDVLAQERRLQHLRAYMKAREGCAHTLILAEAIGYQGGRFSGIAMTCERMLLNHHRSVRREYVFDENYIASLEASYASAAFAVEKDRGWRTSSPVSMDIPKRTQRELGFNEPTDTAVWESILDAGENPFYYVLWNIFPFHPYQEGYALSNRTPTDEELEVGWAYTQEMLSLFSFTHILAVGKKASDTLMRFGVVHSALRHPANGGVGEYRRGFQAFIQEKNRNR